MRSITIFVIMAINLVIQATILQHFRIFDVLPNTSLILIVVFSVLLGKNNGAIIGLITGLVQDIILGSPIGINAFIYLIIGVVIGRLESNIFKDNNLTPVFFTIMATIVYHLLFIGIMYVSNSGFNFLLVMKNILIIEVIYNSILSIFIYKLIYHLCRNPNYKYKVR